MTRTRAATGTPARPAAELVLTGDLARPARPTVADLRGWPGAYRPPL
ncbi:hypothetical protein [Streptomyces sp. CMB-StM0423]|nr:hypothetical protein [Streptomyces sp. CMB-StM0423]